MQRALGLIAALWVFTAPAFAEEAVQQAQREMAFVWFTSYACPDTAMEGPGATPETAIEIAQFGDLYHETFPEGAEPSSAASPYECRWVRVRGFARWINYYDYRATLVGAASDMYSGGRSASYIIENFADPAARRADIAQRDVTIVGRFYDLCAAARREQEASNQIWMTFGPCHYGEDRGLMLRDARISAVHDTAPRYVLGERSRDFYRNFLPLRGETRANAIEATRAWAAAAQRGSTALAEAFITAAAATDRGWTEDDLARMRREYADADSYESYAAARLQRVNLRRAQIEVFQEPNTGNGDTAHGCICLVESCSESWPLFRQDADTFLGEAVCTQLLLRNGAWEWD